jgi:hypothetical protein
MALQPPPPKPITLILAGLATKLVFAISSSFYTINNSFSFGVP